LQVYKGKLYNSIGCILNKKEVKKVAFRFQDKHNFIIQSDFVTIAHDDSENDEDFEKMFYKDFELVEKVTDDLFFYNKM
jgi:hypothetical protein